MTRSPLIKIDLSNVNSLAQVHSILNTALDLPDWYGQNWDAFWDAITNLVEMPVKLDLVGWTVFSERLPRDAKLMQQCLMNLATEYPDLVPEVHYLS